MGLSCYRTGILQRFLIQFQLEVTVREYLMVALAVRAKMFPYGNIIDDSFRLRESYVGLSASVSFYIIGFHGRAPTSVAKRTNPNGIIGFPTSATTLAGDRRKTPCQIHVL
jgi:hypothetical protein